MMEAGFLHLPQQFLRELRDPSIVWEALALAVCIGIALLLQWRFRRRPHAGGEARTAGELGLRRIVFPLSALLLVLVTRAVMRPYAPVGLLDLAVPLFLSLALVRATVFSLRYAFPSARWLAASERVIAGSVWLCLALYLTGLAGPVIAGLESVQFSLGKQKLDLWLVLNGAFTALSTLFVALWIAGWLEHRLLRSESIDSSVRVVLARAGKSVLAVVALLASLALVGIDITALSVFGGAFAVGLGFGLKTIASNYVAGFMILLDRSIRIGNVIALDAATTGEVTQITTRYTVVRTLTGTEVIVPNEYLVTNIIRNQTYTDSQVRLAVRASVAYDSDLERAMQLMVDAAAAQPRVLADPAPGAIVVAFGDNGIELELGFWIPDPGEGTGGIRSDISLAIWKAFRAEGIEFPFPQREVRLLNAAELAGAK
ncbi:mechanosensitive ion channel family protein [Azospira restricta]|uniref:Mechanosensitive ion channel n=1 Tax=Azospira restricta TaxID=404405 RepID=A0A974SNM9_9RHOO|nr:mechanosensitive ion channel domain-containing protein [Azospira restricta]QRJ63533.1 mechanosensitive ion channel [Azospira restricta]